MTLSIEDMAIFCKQKGFIYRSSEIYGGLAGFWDFGPRGVELLNALKASWWKFFVQTREDIVGIDASIISHPKTWEASGHVAHFGDLLLVCSKCKYRVRADHFVGEQLGIAADGMIADEINKTIKEKKLVCPQCKGAFKEANSFNLLFETKVGASTETHNVAYLRGETAQAMFMNFKLIADTCRMQLPFGIAQLGRCFRNEIAPRDFLFRSREFHIAEIEYFLHPDNKHCLLLGKRQLQLPVQVLDTSTQAKGQETLKKMTIQDMIKKNMLEEWHGYFLAEQYLWLLSLGLSPGKLKIRQHVKTELSHYSSATFDIDYAFPFGSKEIAGNANRGQYDLGQHMKFSREKLELFDEASKQKVVPCVIEPTFGLERVFLAILFESYHDDKERGNIILALKPSLAPIKIGVFPLVNKLQEKARAVHALLKDDFPSQYDSSGSIGRRYARADELGIPYCITIDFESLEDDSVTIRDRNTTQQKRVKIVDVKKELYNLI
ncbi:glycine--tRNA ligase [Candidatus Woesearchaeota archaeon]|nr:glycine--tRNA ligase [Candidatus Woesearchaeota archaeon]